MTERNTYDLSHYSFMVGKMGHLMTLSTIPIVAGDSMSINISGALRLSPLRRDLSLDALTDIFAFYVPYRHVYGDNWLDFIRDGYDAPDQVSSTDRFHSHTVTRGANLQYLGTSNISGTVPAWLLTGYNRIWNRYFRIPNGITGEVADNYIPSGEEYRQYGHTSARLRALPLSGVQQQIDAADYTYAAPVASNNAQIDVKGLALQVARYRTELDRAWFGVRYNDIMKTIYDTVINEDADERPTLIIRQQDWMSGYDIEGTGDATLGQYAGKSASLVDVNIPRRFYPEHGTLWLMALLRFPTIFEDERHYLFEYPNASYSRLSGDPNISSRCAPVIHQVKEFFNSDSTVGLGHFPWEQWYRTQPNAIHARYHHVGGFPFIKDIPTSHGQIQYNQPNEFDSVFATTQLGHWRSQFRISVMADRVIVDPRTTIKAGTYL